MNPTTPTPSPTTFISNNTDINKKNDNNRNMIIAGSLLASFFLLYSYYNK